MARWGKHPNIELLTWSEVEEISGFVGNFKAKIRRKARYVDVDKCNGCGACYEACPSRPLPSRRRMILGTRVYKEGSPRVLAPAQKHEHRVSRVGLPEDAEASHA